MRYVGDSAGLRAKEKRRDEPVAWHRRYAGYINLRLLIVDCKRDSNFEWVEYRPLG